MLAQSRLRLESRENRLWGWRKGDNMSLSGVANKEDALQQFQRLDSRVKADDIQSVVFSTVTFNYDSEKGRVATAWASLPQRWE